MDFEDKSLSKGMQSLSSSVQSTPEKNGNSDDGSGSPEEFPNCEPKKELLRTCFDKEKKHSASSKSKSKFGEVSKNGSKPSKKSDATHAGKKANRKGENPARVAVGAGHADESGTKWTWTCKNSACKAVWPSDEAFCKRCSCCICHLFDDNKDPSLWLECTSEDPRSECCGMSCHAECAIQHGLVGVADMGQFMHLDASFCCASCGKVSPILSFWRKQLAIAKDARRVDVLCYRINLSFRLLEGSTKLKQVHEMVSEAKRKLEAEVGPTDVGWTKMARGIVSRLAVGGEVQRLCAEAMERSEEHGDGGGVADVWVPAACKFVLEEVGSSSVSIVIVSGREEIKEYKMWYWKTKEERRSKDPNCVFESSRRRIVVSNMQPCTEYSFKIVSLSEDGEVGHSEAKCFTRSRDISKRDRDRGRGRDRGRDRDRSHDDFDRDRSHDDVDKQTAVKKIASLDPAGFRVRDLGYILRERFSAVGRSKLPLPSRDLDLNVATVPDLNEELVPPFDDPPCNLLWAEDVPTADSRAPKRSAPEDCDSTLISGSPFRPQNAAGSLDDNFEECVKIIRWLECGGHINKDFRLRLLTWFSLRSTPLERRVVNTFIQTLIDDPACLAGQLVDSFNDIISAKAHPNAFCTKLWH